jgi:hypothetical protein
VLCSKTADLTSWTYVLGSQAQATVLQIESWGLMAQLRHFSRAIAYPAWYRGVRARRMAALSLKVRPLCTSNGAFAYR